MADTEEEIVRINILLPESERDAFDNWCRLGGKPRLSMTAMLREFIRAATAGKIKIDRKHAKQMARAVTAKRNPK